MKDERRSLTRLRHITLHDGRGKWLNVPSGVLNQRSIVKPTHRPVWITDEAFPVDEAETNLAG